MYCWPQIFRNGGLLWMCRRKFALSSINFRRTHRLADDRGGLAMCNSFSAEGSRRLENASQSASVAATYSNGNYRTAVTCLLFSGMGAMAGRKGRFGSPRKCELEPHCWLVATNELAPCFQHLADRFNRNSFAQLGLRLAISLYCMESEPQRARFGSTCSCTNAP